MRFMRSGRFLLAACASAVCLSLTPTAPAQVTPGQARAALEAQYPSVRFYEKGERVRTVYSAKMTRGMTPEEAGEAWLAAHGAAFGTDQPDVQRFRSIPLYDGERTVLMYKQRMDDLPVVGSSLRILVRGESPAQVVYAAGRIAIRPEGGLPEPAVTPAEAVAAAQAHPFGRDLGPWSEPELVAAFDDVPNGEGVAYPAWKFSGAGTVETARSFLVHAVTGRVTRHVQMAWGIDEITGTAEGHATPGLKAPTSDFTSTCPNDAVEIGLANVLIEAYDGMTLVDSTFTDVDGDYTLDVPGSTTVDLFASLASDASVVYETTENNHPAIWGEPLDPLHEPMVTSPDTQDFNFNPDPPTEFGTASVNVQVQMAKTWDYLSPSYSIPAIPIIVHPFVLPRAAYYPEGFIVPPSCFPPINWCEPSDPAPAPGRIFLSGEAGSPTQPSSQHSDLAFSTVITHEYGHFWLYMVPEIVGLGDEGSPGFHEGFADTLSHMVHITPLIGEKAFPNPGRVSLPRHGAEQDLAQHAD